MAELRIKPVATRREKKQFLDLPWTLYRGDPNWIPPLRMDQKERVNYSWHPFYETNQIQTFLAYRGDQVCGRIAAILNQGHIDRHHERRGFFGFFECTNDVEAAHGLFDAVRDWFAARDIRLLRGPTNPSLNYELGLLVEGFDSPPTFMMTYNPPYYANLLESYGFRKTQDLYAYWGNMDMLPQVAVKLGPLSQKVTEHLGVRMRPLNTKRFLQDVEGFLNVYNQSLTNTWGFVPMSQAEVRHMAKGLRYLIVPELALGAEIDGKLIGAVFGLPDYNPRIRAIKGRLFPFGFLKLLRNKKSIERIRLISTNVLPEYQLMGVGLVMLAAMAPAGIAWGLKEAEFSWVLESNTLSRGSLEKGGAKRVKTYRLYDWPNPSQEAARA